MEEWAIREGKWQQGAEEVAGRAEDWKNDWLG
jgi:hypothetical protein